MEYLTSIQSQQQVAAESYLAQIKANNKRFFEYMAQAFQKDLAEQHLRAFLFNAAWQTGFKDIRDALSRARNGAGQSLLTLAYQEQNFKYAQSLIKWGAPVGPEERAIYELALDSKAARSFGLIQDNSNGKKLHVVKRFGLTLGIVMTSVDGTFSQYGHSAPTYQMMTDIVTAYADKYTDNTHFQHIAAAFQFTNETAAYSFSTANNPHAGKDIVARIRCGRAGTVTTIPTSCKGHEMALSFVSDGQGGGYMIFTNRGKGGKGVYGTHIFKLDDFSKVTPQFVNNMLNGHSSGSTHAQIMGQIYKVAGGQTPAYFLPQKAQKRDNCTIANPRANIHGILLCLTALQQNKSVAKLNDTEHQTVKKAYKHFTGEMRLNKVKELTSALAKNPNNIDLINLAKAYLKQHPNAHFKLRGPLMHALTSSKCREFDPMGSLCQASGHRLKVF